MIETAPGREACVCDLTAAFTVTQPAISHHLRILTDASLVRRDRRGIWHWYSLIAEHLEALHHLLPGPAFLAA